MSENATPTSAASSATAAASSLANKQRTEQQIKKLKDANTKYKDLLKMAKERIQAQEEEIERMKGMYVYINVYGCVCVSICVIYV